MSNELNEVTEIINSIANKPITINDSVKTFTNIEFGNVRILGTYENPLFCLGDICKILELRVDNTVKRLSNEDDPFTTGVISKHQIVDSIGRTQEAYFVNEDGLYDTILDSRKPNAKKFRKWITKEVLPSLRLTGVYAINDRSLIREASKRARKEEVGAINAFAEYARNQGSDIPASKFFSTFSILANIASGIKDGERDNAPSHKLFICTVADTMIKDLINSGMILNKKYDEIFKEIHSKLLGFSAFLESSGRFFID